MFVGRVEEIDTIEQCLFQTKHGNPQHFLIEGERGIGKSSLLFLAEAISCGHAPDRDKNKMNFLTIAVDMGGVETQLDVVRAIGRKLRASLDERQALKQAAVEVWNFLSQWEVLGVRFHGENRSDSEDARDELVNRLATLLAQAGDSIEGVFVVIDEADAAKEEAGLGQFLKLFTERLARRDCSRVLLGLAGLPSTITKLRESHESSPRLFEVLRLEPLAQEERKRVVRRGLKEAAEKNGFETRISDDAMDLIADLSEGYPHFVQQFAFSAFAEDDDGVIDAEDVRRGAYKENGALQQLGHKYFSEMYHAKISSEEYRRVLGAMAKGGDDWISRKDLIQVSGVSAANVTNALAALKERNIILSDESRRGFYRLPTKSFAAWINAIRSIELKTGQNGPDLFGS
jgi:hypothetical protein